MECKSASESTTGCMGGGREGEREGGRERERRGGGKEKKEQLILLQYKNVRNPPHYGYHNLHLC